MKKRKLLILVQMFLKLLLKEFLFKKEIIIQKDIQLIKIGMK